MTMNAAKESKLSKLGILAALLLLVAPSTIATHTTTEAIVGHTIFVDMGGYDPCLGAIAGLTRLRVMWFNDQPLYERASVDEGTYLYALEHGAEDPRDKKIVPSGTKYEFADPNGHSWSIVEGYFDLDPRYETEGQASVSLSGISGREDHSVVLNRTYVWIVQIRAGEPLVNDQNEGFPEAAFYNFVTMVNTCKFHDYLKPSRTVEHDPADGVDVDNYEGEHETSYDAHEHEAYLVDLWIGTEPDYAPVNFEPDPDGVWVRIGSANDLDCGTHGSHANGPGCPNNPDG